MKALSTSKVTASTAIFILLLVALALRPAVKWMSYEVFDMDEAGQFWMAKGLNHDSAPYSSFGTLQDALKNNRYYNMDPGGFTALLYFWSKISNDIHFLRILPILFYFGFLLGLFLIGKHLLRSSMWALAFTLLGVLPHFQNLFHYLSFPFAARVGYLRAYTMEMCGVVLTVAYMLKHRADERLSYSYLLKLSILMAFFCTSRYGFVITAFALSLRTLLRLYVHRDSLADFFKRSVVFGLPLLLMVATIYFGETKYQNGDIRLLPYYTTLHMKPVLLLSWLSVSLYLVAFYSLHQLKVQKKRPCELFIITLFVGPVFLILSALNIYPWSPLSTMPVMILTQFSLMYIFLNWLQKIILDKLFIPILASVLILLNLVLWPMGIRSLSHNDNTEELSEIENACQSGKPVLVSSGMNPVCRYLFEYGILKSNGYPSFFSFQTGTPHPDGFFSHPTLAHQEFDYQDFAWYLADSRLGEGVPEGFICKGHFTYSNETYATTNDL